MNVVELKPLVPREMRNALLNLPEFDPPADLWQRIRVDLPRRSWQSQRRIWLAGVAALLALGVVSLVPYRANERGSTAAAAVQSTRDLEQALALVRVVPTSNPELVPLEARLRRVDARLQRAYDEAASDEELAALWSDRAELLRMLTAGYRRSNAVVQI